MLEKSNKMGDWFMIKATWTATMGRGSNFPQRWKFKKNI